MIFSVFDFIIATTAEDTPILPVTTKNYLKSKRVKDTVFRPFTPHILFIKRIILIIFTAKPPLFYLSIESLSVRIISCMQKFVRPVRIRLAQKLFVKVYNLRIVVRLS